MKTIEAAKIIISQQGSCVNGIYIPCKHCPGYQRIDGSYCGFDYEARPIEKLDWFKKWLKENDKEKNMSNRVQMTEEEAIQIHEDCILDFGITSKQCFLNGLKEKGYIRKSDLQQKVEEAEMLWRNTPNSLINELHRRQHETIQALKENHPEFKK